MIPGDRTMQLLELKNYRKEKEFKKQMVEIQEQPYIEVADETVSNCAVYGRRSDNKSIISVKFNPVFNSFAVEIESANEADVMRIIEKIKEIG